MNKKITLIVGNAPITNNGNQGCVALSVSTLYLLSKILSKRNIDYQIFFCDNINYKGHAGKENYDVGDREFPYFNCFNMYPGKGKAFLKFCATGCIRPKEYMESIKIFQQADFILDIGIGDSFADIYGKERFYEIDRIHRAARLLHKPYCFLPQTIGPFKDASVRQDAAKSLEKASMVMTRDTKSLKYVHKIAPNQKNVYSCIDVAFFLPYKKMDFDKQSIHVGLNVSALLWHGGYTKDNQFGLCLDYPHAVRKIIDYFLNQPNVVIHLIPHVVGAEKHVENDYWISYNLFRKYNHSRLVLSPFFMDPSEAKAYISGMDFFMGARMHSTIAAYSSCVPVVPMAYSRKFTGLFHNTLNYPYVADMRKDTEPQLLEIIQKAFARRVSLKNQEESQMQTTVAKLGEEMEEHICRFLGLE